MGSGYNKAAIEIFGRENSEMLENAPNRQFDLNLSRLTAYLDQRIIEEWILPDLRQKSIEKPIILDVGAGKGRMARYFENVSNQCVAIEPYNEFYDFLKNSVDGKNVEVHKRTLSEYAAISKKKHDLIYASGVTLYLTDDELKDFMLTAERLLNPGGLVCVRDFGSEKEEIRTKLEISRTRKSMLECGREAGLRCRRWRRAYPLIVFNKIHQIWPNHITKAIWDLTSHRITYPFWNMLAKLNMPRGNRRCFYVYLYEKR